MVHSLSHSSSNTMIYAEPNSSNNSSPFPGTQRTLYKLETDKTRYISRGRGMGEEDCRVASGQIKMQEFYSPASVFCVLRLKEDLALCIFLIVICV